MTTQLLLQRIIFSVMLRFGLGYVPTPHDLEILGQMAKQSRFQVISYGLVRSCAENALKPENFVPFLSVGPACSNYLSQMPTSEQ
jgi:hypothetical protein